MRPGASPKSAALVANSNPTPSTTIHWLLGKPSLQSQKWDRGQVLLSGNSSTNQSTKNEIYGLHNLMVTRPKERVLGGFTEIATLLSVWSTVQSIELIITVLLEGLNKAIGQISNGEVMTGSIALHLKQKELYLNACQVSALSIKGGGIRGWTV